MYVKGEGGLLDLDLARDLGPRRLLGRATASDGLEAHRLVLDVDRDLTRRFLMESKELASCKTLATTTNFVKTSVNRRAASLDGSGHVFRALLQALY